MIKVITAIIMITSFGLSFNVQASNRCNGNAKNNCHAKTKEKCGGYTNDIGKHQRQCQWDAASQSCSKGRSCHTR